MNALRIILIHTLQTELDALIQTLDKAIPDRDWLKFLELVSRTGVADTRQLQLHLGWTRGIFSRRAEKLLVRIQFLEYRSDEGLSKY